MFVGGILERGHTDSIHGQPIIGPVFKCIIADTFARLKIGDRFFYDLGLNENTRFSTIQLTEIRKVTMARIICDNNEGISEIQPEVFKATTDTNRKVSCGDFKNIPKTDWRHVFH